MNIKKERLLPGLLLFAFLITGIWGINQYLQKLQYHVYMQNQYQRMFYELIGHVENIQVDLAKTQIASSPEQNIVLLSDIWKQSFAAQEKLNQLPISHIALNKTAKFLSQAGDYSFSLSRKSMEGKTLDSKQLETLQGLHNTAANLTQELQNIMNRITDGKINLGELRREGYEWFSRVSNNEIDNDFEKVQKKAIDYPKLIYDGPFSEHIENIKPMGLTGPEITLDEAISKAKKFLSPEHVRTIKKASNGQGFIKTYGFEIMDEDRQRNMPIYMDISRKGGHVVWMLDNRKINKPTINQEQAVEIASSFLEKKGFENMVATYSFNNKDTVVTNFAYSKDGIICYPDLIKVKVALDNGKVVGYDATGYLTFHRERKVPKPELSEEEARKLISSNFNTGKGRLALIPLDDKSEVLCYEFKGDFQGDKFIIYINAVNGREEKLLKVIENKNGIFTM